MPKDFDGWNTIKKKVNKIEFLDFIHERELWWCSLGVNVGFEQDGKHDNFERPVLILKKFSNYIALVVPISTKVKNRPYHFPYMHDGQEYSALLPQLRLISTKRLLRKIYMMDSAIFMIIKQAVKDML